MAKEMSEAARAAQREYHRRYRKNHEEQIKENRRRYWERKALKYRAESEENNEQKEDD